MRFERQNISGYQLRLAQERRGHRPTLVLTNAFPQSIRCWASVWDRLAQHYDLLAVDLAGFGRSEGSAAVMRPSAQAELLAEVMRVNNIDRAFLVGPDVGVPISLWLASTRPELLQGINIFDGPGMWATDFDPALAAAVRWPLVRWLGNRWPLRSRLMKQNFSAATSTGYHRFKPAADVIDEYRAICFDPARHENAFAYLGSYAEELPVLEQRLSGIEVPVLITWGQQDQFVRPVNAERLHGLLPTSELTIFSEAGHFSHEDADERWLKRLLAFTSAHSHPRRTQEDDGAARDPTSPACT